MGIFQAIDLTKNYGKVPVLDRLNMEVAESSVFGLVGPNGAGKTTMIKILMNLLRADSGEVRVLGKDSRTIGADDLTQIGYISENQEFPEWMTVGYLMTYLKPFYPNWDDDHAAIILRMFDLPAGRALRHLSRGMRMKAMFASVLAYRPKLLVMDEPFSGLDPVVREDLIDGLRASAAETTIFVSSHDLGEIESFATHVGYLDRGRLQFNEEMESLTARFREVEVPGSPPSAIDWPKTWLRREVTPDRVRFVESRFDAERTASEIRQVFGENCQATMTGMQLRAIFLALARNAAKERS